MSAEILSFETGRPAELSSDEPSLVVDVEGYEGPARSVACAGAATEGRPAQDIDSGAGRPVSGLHRGRPKNSPGACRRLFGDGGMAGFSQIAAVAAGAGDAGWSQCRRNGDRAGQSLAPAGGHSGSVEPADEPPAIAARHLSARPAGIHRGNPASPVHSHAVRSAHRLCGAAPAARVGQRASGETHGVVADRGARVARASCRHGRGLEPARRIPHQLRRRSLAKGHRFASSFAAALEMVREGEVELHQSQAFAPLYFRKRPPQPMSDAHAAPDTLPE